MSAAAARALRRAWTAAGDFLRGFTGMARDGDPARDSGHGPHHLHRGEAQPTAASVRAALAERAARRPSCC